MFYIKQNLEVEEITKSTLEDLQKLTKVELDKAKEAPKLKLDADKAQKEKLIKIIDSFKEKYKDKWTAAPEHNKKLVDEKNRKNIFRWMRLLFKIICRKNRL